MLLHFLIAPLLRALRQVNVRGTIKKKADPKMSLFGDEEGKGGKLKWHFCRLSVWLLNKLVILSHFRPGLCLLHCRISYNCVTYFRIFGVL